MSGLLTPQNDLKGQFLMRFNDELNYSGFPLRLTKVLAPYATFIVKQRSSSLRGCGAVTFVIFSRSTVCRSSHAHDA